MDDRSTPVKRDGSAEAVLDELLVLRVQEGSRAAFERLVTRWQERLWRHAFRLTGRDDTAWDVIQESWMAITRAFRSSGIRVRFAAGRTRSSRVP